MAESSLPWSGIVTGDAGPYSDDNWSDFWNTIFCFDRTAQGPIAFLLNELAVSGATSPVSVATGAALVDGKYYLNNAAESVVVPTPVADTRIDRIVLRKSWAAQTVRITRIAGVEGGAAPAITQNDGTTWDVPLAQLSTTVAGNITVTDQREFLWSAVSLLGQITKRDTPTNGDIILADSAQDGKVKFADRIRIVTVEPFSMKDSATLANGDGVAFVPIPTDANNYELCYVRAWVDTAPSGGVVSIMIHNVTTAVDMLSTALTIDDGETSSITAATPAVIKSDGSEDVDDGDQIRIDLDASNSAAGLQVELGFRPR